jgi:hypothetical protein
MLRRPIIYLFLIVVFSIGILPLQAQDREARQLNELLSEGEEIVEVVDLTSEEPFDDDNVWETFEQDEYAAFIEDGAFIMTITGSIFTWALNDERHEDVVIQLDTSQLSKDESSTYGVICRADTTNNGDGYYFRISGTGSGSIIKVEGDEQTNLVDWDENRAINPGRDDNQIVAVCVGEYLALYVNDELIGEATDDAFSRGFVGLTAGGFEDESDVEIAFDNVQVWEAEATSGGGGNTVGGSDMPSELRDFGGDSEDAIAELEDLGVIPSGSSLLFGEDYAFFTGRGAWFTSLASRSPRQDIVMAGELTFTVGDDSEFESCTLISRINTDSRGTATTYIDVGIINSGFIYLEDVFSETERSNSVVSNLEVDLDDPQHFLIVLLGDQASVYVNGELAIDRFEVAQRAGSYGIGLIGAGEDARCDARNIWVYQVPKAAAEGECIVSSSRDVNKRTGPGTNFERAGQLGAGQDATVIGQNQDAEGFTWWQLEDETWVREDVVQAVGDCAGVPEANP